MAERLAPGGVPLIGFHRLVRASGGASVPELAALVEARAGRSAEIIPFPVQGKAAPRRPALLFCEICRFPARVRPSASAAGR
ncbi:MAG: hypothetical protein DI589_07185 [Shinella sp.]|nr:MAG: hypothetical protein DI589_07185 [Shinella sp.]